MLSTSCVVCGDPALPALSWTHRECSHTSHSKCLKGDGSDLKKCASCLIGAPIAVATTVFSKNKEPRLTDGIDYVKEPGTVQETGIKDSLLKLVGRPIKPSIPESIQMLNSKMQIKDMWAKGVGLDHLLRDGATITDFLHNGYGLKDLRLFEDISKRGPERSLEAFCSPGLGLSANHLRDKPNQLPIKDFRELTHIGTGDIKRKLGLYFSGGHLSCWADTDWNAQHCIALGLTIADLEDLGLKTTEQYLSLYDDLTKSEKADAEAKLGVTAEFIASLADAPIVRKKVEENEEAEEYKDDSSSASSPPPQQKKKVKPPKLLQKIEVQEDDDDEEEEEEPPYEVGEEAYDEEEEEEEEVIPPPKKVVVAPAKVAPKKIAVDYGDLPPSYIRRLKENQKKKTK